MFPERLRALRHGKHITLEVLCQGVERTFSR